MTVQTSEQRRLRRRRRVRARVSGTAERPRLSVYRSNKGAFAPPASARPTSARELRAGRPRAAGVETCVFDRGGYQYHGRVKALAEGAREGGLGRHGGARAALSAYH